MEEKNYVVGIDLGTSYVQVSYVTFEGEEGDLYDIPLCVAKEKGMNLWYFGKEAVDYAKKEDATLVDNLLQLAAHEESVTVEGKSIPVTQLFALFCKQLFASMGLTEAGVTVKSLVFSVKDLSPGVLQVLEYAKESVMSDFSKVSFQTTKESLFHYLVHQPKGLLSYEVEVFDFSASYLCIYQVKMHPRSKPILTTIDDFNYPELTLPHPDIRGDEKELAYKLLDKHLLETAGGFFEGNIVTGIYLVGKTFETPWYEESLKLLCRNRKVFQGSNLYSKGACLSGIDVLSPEKANKEYIYLGKEKLKHHIGVACMDQGKLVEKFVLEGGSHWYGAKAEFTFMPSKDYHLPILIYPLDGGPKRVVPVVLPTFEGRDYTNIQFGCTLSLQSDTQLTVELKDLGFGSFYPSTGRSFYEVIDLGGPT